MCAQVVLHPGQTPEQVYVHKTRVLQPLPEFLPEDATSAVGDVLDELLGLHPPASVMVQHSSETILNLVQTGRVILVGWGANVITNHLPNVFQVRLVGSLEKRLERIKRRDRLSREEARAFIERQDRGRERYVRKNFGQRLSDAFLYHLTINTDRFPDAEVVRLIAEAALNQYHAQPARDFELSHPM